MDARGILCQMKPGAWPGRSAMAFAEHRFDREPMAIESDPPEPRLSQLLGSYVGPGFRARMSEILPDHVAGQTLLHALLDDLPGATLVSGYAVQRGPSHEALSDQPAAGAYERHVHASEDMCAGWATDATIMVTFRKEGLSPVAMGPDAPLLEREGDALLVTPWRTSPAPRPHLLLDDL